MASPNFRGLRRTFHDPTSTTTMTDAQGTRDLPHRTQVRAPARVSGNDVTVVVWDRYGTCVPRDELCERLCLDASGPRECVQTSGQQRLVGEATSPPRRVHLRGSES